METKVLLATLLAHTHLGFGPNSRGFGLGFGVWGLETLEAVKSAGFTRVRDPNPNFNLPVSFKLQACSGSMVLLELLTVNCSGILVSGFCNPMLERLFGRRASLWAFSDKASGVTSRCTSGCGRVTGNKPNFTTPGVQAPKPQTPNTRKL